MAYLKEAAVDVNKIPESPWVKAWRLELEAKGKAEGEARAVLKVLSARGLAVTEAQAAKVLACQDLAQLDAWLRAVASVPSMEALLGIPSAS
ncbi:MAG: hypothetical protein HY909_24935 [Deltaproteobacteria bacterium]|nr:hypothetical protein [Deltaproteobacteria bacterium]